MRLILPVFFFLFAIISVSVATTDIKLATFVILNIPTLVYLGIYFSYKGKRQKNVELEKMNIQDLE